MVNVVGENGSLIKDLHKEEFIATYRGRTANIVNLTYVEGPRRVVVLLDTSSSMKGDDTGKDDKWRLARTAVSDLVGSLPRGSKVGLITFTNKTQTQAALSSDVTIIREWLDREAKLQSPLLKGHTALYEGILVAVNALTPPEPGDAIYVISDAGENASKARLPDVESALRTNAVRVFAFVLLDDYFGHGPPPDEQDGSMKLSGLCKNSGGSATTLAARNVRPFDPLADWRFVFDDSARDQINSFAHLFSQQITGFYTLTFQIPERLTKVQKLALEVVDKNGHSRKDLILIYPHKLYPCEATSESR